MKTLEQNTITGQIGEHIARCFIRNMLAPKLVKEEGWSRVVFSGNDYKLHARREKLFSFDRYREDFLVHGYYADTKLLSRYAETADTLLRNHCSPDGLLMKLRENGIRMQLKEINCPRVASLRFDSKKNGDRMEFPVASGDLEIVEIKCGRHAKRARAIQCR